MFCFTKYLSQSPFFEKFLKSEGVCSPCYCNSPYCDTSSRQPLLLVPLARFKSFCEKGA